VPVTANLHLKNMKLHDIDSIITSMRVAYVQTSPTLGTVSANLDEAWSFIEKVKEADLVVLPELFHTGYMVRNRDEAKAHAVSRDKSSDPLEMCLDACRTFGMSIAAGFLEIDDKKTLFNSSWLIDSGGIVSAYRKIHLFYLEVDIFEPGDDIAPAAEVASKRTGRVARVGMQICFDWIFPENWGRLAWGEGGKNGAQIIAHPANLVIPDLCPLAIRTRAVENHVFIVTAGRVGVDPGPSGEIIFCGGSRIVAPDGEVLAAGHDDRPGCDMVEINPEWADDKLITPLNNVLQERFSEQKNDRES